MNKLSINIGGIPTEIEEKEIEVEKICLDQENPRIGLFKDTQVRTDLTQEEITFALMNKNPDAFNKLKESIEVNEGIINPIWIQPVNKTKYLIIEGNTRLIIYKLLSEKYPHKEIYENILCRVLPKKIDEKQKDFIKLEAHLRGTTPWDAYEKARYLYILNDKEGNSIKRLQSLTKLSENEIKSAIQAFLDMQEQYLPRYGDDPKEVFKFSYFMEFEKNRKLKEEMKKNNLTISDFCNWVGTEKIPRAQLVRDLQPILAYKESRKEFIRKGYDYAVEKLSLLKPALTSPLFESIKKVIEGLRELPSWELSEIIDGLQPEKKRLIDELHSHILKIKNIIEKD